jgi:DNA (cytosine-5)-methyltransferase 1
MGNIPLGVFSILENTMTNFTSLITSKIGESRGVARLWLEGQKLLRAGVKIGTRYEVRHDRVAKKLELVPCEGRNSSRTFTVSRRERNGVISPLLEIRSALLREVFTAADKVRVVIRLGRILITQLDREHKAEERLRRIQNKLLKSEPLAVCSLFHGAGVMDRAIHTGLLRSGVGSFVQIGIELEGQYIDTSLRNNPMLWTDESIAICSDVRAVRRGPEIPQCDVLVAGIPCTGASRSGKAKNKLLATEDHPAAGALFSDFLEFVRFTNPALAIIENVPDYLNSTSMMVIRSVLSSLGYRLFECILDGAKFGALENRSRMAVVAYTEGVFDELIEENIKPVRTKETSLQAILDPVADDDPRWRSFDYLRDKEERDLAAGKNFQRQLLTAESATCGCLGKGYAKARSTEPFLVHPARPELSRLFTAQEHARLKTVPEDMIKGVSETIAHEILGQSVIFAAFEALAAAVGRLIVASLHESELIAA